MKLKPALEAAFNIRQSYRLFDEGYPANRRLVVWCGGTDPFFVAIAPNQDLTEYQLFYGDYAPFLDMWMPDTGFDSYYPHQTSFKELFDRDDWHVTEFKRTDNYTLVQMLCIVGNMLERYKEYKGIWSYDGKCKIYSNIGGTHDT